MITSRRPNLKQQVVHLFSSALLDENKIILKYQDLIDKKNGTELVPDLDMILFLKSKHLQVVNHGHQWLHNKEIVSASSGQDLIQNEVATPSLSKSLKNQWLRYEVILAQKYLERDLKHIIKEIVIPNYYQILNHYNDVEIFHDQFE